MSYKLIDANNIAFNSDGFITAENIVKMPCIYADLPNGMDGEHYVLEQEPKTGHWIPVSERLPEEDGDYLVTYEKGYAEDYDLPLIGIVGFEVDCESFGYWYEQFDRQTMGSLGSEWEEIKVIAWMSLSTPYEPQESEGEG